VKILAKYADEIAFTPQILSTWEIHNL
jgi:hypothetical protein